jgi:hypothetical protein
MGPSSSALLRPDLMVNRSHLSRAEIRWRINPLGGVEVNACRTAKPSSQP